LGDSGDKRGEIGKRRRMMKKAVLVFLLCGISVVCFAKGNFEFYGGMPFQFEKADAGDSSMRSFSLGFAGISPLNDFIALGCYDNFIFPLELSSTLDGTKVTTKRDDYDSLFGVDMLLGPVFTLYSAGKVKIPLAAGLHLFLLTASTGSVSTIGFEFGLGTSISAEYHFGDRVYGFGRVQGTWDFYATNTVRTAWGRAASNSGRLRSLGVNPNIGVGFKL
jgi:hypothetical protein